MHVERKIVDVVRVRVRVLKKKKIVFKSLRSCQENATIKAIKDVMQLNPKSTSISFKQRSPCLKSTNVFNMFEKESHNIFK